MDTRDPERDSTAATISRCYASYRADFIRLVDPDLRRFSHLVASRQGLFVVRESVCKLIVEGLFFGITFRGSSIYVFEACDLPRAPSRQGRILRFEVEDERIVRAEVVVKGLDNGCHAIDFVGDDLYVVDTYNQQLLRLREGEPGWQTVHPLPRISQRGAGPTYVHVNSILAVGDQRLLLLHHGGTQTGRRSEIAVYDRDWTPLERWGLDGSGCHGLALLEDGTVLSCGSMEGNLISATGLRMKVSPHLTRGLAVGRDSVVVGASEKVQRDGRLRNAGTITFMDREYRVRSILPIPGAPTEVRRLDGLDSSLSNFLHGVEWGRVMKYGDAVTAGRMDERS